MLSGSTMLTVNKVEAPKVDKTSEKHKSEGHRKRLRERFLQSGLGGFHDYEIVELFLTLGTPQKDCKPTASYGVNNYGAETG